MVRKGEIRISRLKQSDIRAASELLTKIIEDLNYYTPKEKNESIEEHSIRRFKALLKEKNRIFRVAKIGGKIVGIIEGFLPVDINPVLCWITWIAVSKEYRRRHIGSMLISSLENGPGIRWQRIQGNVRIGNVASNNMLKKLGYKNIDIVTRRTRKESAYKWEKFLQPYHMKS